MNGDLNSKCPNCGAQRVLSADKTKLICNYCDTEFLLPKKACASQKINEDNGLMPAQKLFDIANVKSFGTHGDETWNLICVCLNQETDLNKYLEYLTTMTQNESFMAMRNINKDLYAKAYQRVSPHLSNGEELIFYKDSGIFSKGKEGIVITNKKLLFFKKNKLSLLELKDIHSLKNYKYNCAGSNLWFFNRSDYMIDGMACTDKQLGIILAFICKMAQDLNGDNYKITIDIGE